ncbi:MAG: translocation/assembly module TamB domain-containing protein [Myxococcales bacterium]|jgi:translocation and assembly module TamB
MDEPEQAPKKRSIPSRAARGLGHTVWAAVLAALCVVATTIIHLQLPIARRVANEWLNDVANDAIAGTLVVGSIDTMTLHELGFSHVVVFDPDGRVVIRARRVTLIPDWDAILDGEVRFAHARLTGGVVRLVDSGDGLPTMISAFDTPGPDVPEEDDTPATRVVVDDIVVRGVRVRGEMLGLSGIVGRIDEGRWRLQIDDEVRVTLHQVSGVMRRPFGFPARIESLTGTISTAPAEGVDLYVKGRRGMREQADGHVTYRATGEDPEAEWELSVGVQTDRIHRDTIQSLGFDWFPPLRVPLTGELLIRGPVDALKITADVQTDAGEASVEGEIGDGFSVTIRTDGLQMDEAFQDAPALEVRGSMRVEARADETEPRAHAEVEPIVFGDLRVPKLIVDGTFAEEGIRIDRVRTQDRGSLITGRGQVDDSGALRFSLRAQSADISREPNLARLLPGARGKLDARLDIRTASVSSGRITFRGRIVLTNLSYGPLRAERLVVEGSVRGDPERPALDVAVDGTGVRFGAYPLGDSKLTVEGGPRKYTANGQFVTGGRRTFNLDATIRAEPDGFVIDAEPIEVVVGDGSWRGALRGLRIRGSKRVDLELLRLANRSQRLEARASILTPGPDEIHAQLQDFDLAAVHALLGDAFPLREGRADAMFELTGDVERPELLVQGALRGGHVLDIADVGALYLVTYADGQLELDTELDLGPRGVVRMSGTGALDADERDPLVALRRGRYDLELSSEGLLLGLLPLIQDAGVSGRLGGKLALAGTIEDPRAEGSLELDGLSAPQLGPLTVVSDVRYERGELSSRVAVGDVRGPLAILGGDLTLDLAAAARDPSLVPAAVQSGPWRLSGQTLARKLADMPSIIAAAAPYPLEVMTRFDLHKRDGATEGELSFGMASVEPFEGSDCAEQTEAEARGTFTLEGGTTRLDAMASVSGVEIAHVRGMAETPLDAWLAGKPVRQPALFQATADLSVGRMEKLPFLCEVGKGRLDAEVELDGGMATEPLLVASIRSTFLPRVVRPSRRRDINTTTCKGDPMHLTLDLSADSRNLSGSGQLDGCGGGVSEISGRLGVQWDSLKVLPLPRPDGRLQAIVSFDSAQLKPLLDQIPGVRNARALARGNLSLSGSLQAPQARGSVEVTGGELYLVAAGQQLRGMDAVLDFRGNWVRVEELRALAGDGELRSNGGISFEGFRPSGAQVALALEQFPLRREGAELAWLTGHAALDASIESARMRAAVKLHDLEVRLPDATNRSLQPLEPHPDVVVVTEVEPIRSEPYAVELVIDGRRPFRVRRNDFDVTITSELAVSYLDPDLLVGGFVQFQDGQFEVLGKRFDLRGGSMRFDGSSELNPDVNLLATHRPLTGGSSPVDVNVTGTLLEPEVSFSSEACPGESNAAIYLISGRCEADDPFAQQEAENTENAFAAGVVGVTGGLVTLVTRGQLGSEAPRISMESTGGGAARFKAGIVNESLIPEFMRPLVQRVYVQGALSTGSGETTTADATASEDADTTLDFLIELYFPHNIVGSGKFAPRNWGLDVTWEP